MQVPSQLSTPFYSQLILRIYTAMNGLGVGTKTEFATGREKPLVRHWFNVTFLRLRLCYENTRNCFSKDAENLTTYGYVL